MSDILLNATLKEKESKKGTKYTVVEVEITPNVKKQVFLEQAELELVKLYYSQKQQY